MLTYQCILYILYTVYLSFFCFWCYIGPHSVIVPVGRVPSISIDRLICILTVYSWNLLQRKCMVYT